MILQPNMAAVPQPGVQIAQPMNDAQLVSLVAATLTGHGGDWDAALVVEQAIEVVAHACVAVQQGALGRRAQEIQAEPPPEA